MLGCNAEVVGQYPPIQFLYAGALLLNIYLSAGNLNEIVIVIVISLPLQL